MRLFSLLIFFIYVFVCSVYGQAINPKINKIDSLERVIATTKVDTTKGRALCRLCAELVLKKNFDLASKKLDEGLLIVNKHQDNIGIANCYTSQALYFRKQQKFNEAIKAYDRAEVLYKKSNDLNRIAFLYFLIGQTYKDQQNHAKALSFFNKSYDLYKEMKQEVGMVKVLNSIATIYNQQSNHVLALESYFKALKMSEKIGDKRRAADINNNIGIIYVEQKKYAEALVYQQKSYDYEKKSGSPKGLISSLLNISSLLVKLDKANQGINLLKEAIRLADSIQDPFLLAVGYEGMGSIYKEQSKTREAINYFQKSLEIREQLQDQAGIAATLINIGNCYWDMKDYQTSLRYADKGFQTAKSISHLLWMTNGLSNIFQSKASLGDYKGAYEAHLLFTQYTDSLHNEDKAREFGRLEAQYEHEKQRETEALKEAERRLRANYTYSGIIAIVLISGGFFFYRYRAKAKLNRALQSINEELAFKNQEIAEQRDELTIYNEEIITQRDELSAQADQLATQRDELDHAYHQLQELDEFKEALSGMIVHDLKNPLSAIIGLSEKTILTAKDQITIRQAGKQMLNLTLNILDVQKFEQTQVPLHLKDEALLTIVHDAIEQVSLLIANKNLQINITFEPATGVFCDTELITRVLMNLLTNAIKYTANNGSITIGAEEIPDNQVKISVSDTGQGIPADKLDTVFDKFSQVEAKKSGGARSTGLGLTFCKMTVEAHGGQIGVASEVGVGTTFYFTLAKALNEINPVQPFILPTNTITEINLTAEDQALLQPYLEKLRAFDVYEAGEVLKIIAPIPDTPALAGWKSEMESTVFASNQERFVELLITN